MSTFEEGEFDFEIYEATGGLPYDEAERVEQEILAERQAKAQEILDDPNRDWYQENRPLKPKYEIGKYVASQGFNVPLITRLEDWQAAMDEGHAMLRSESTQDYSGLSGLNRSLVLGRESVLGKLAFSFNSDQGFLLSLGEEILRGLRNGQLNFDDFMENLASSQRDLLEEANRLGISLEMGYISASPWRYVPGTNIRIFRDTTVKNRYHIGFRAERNSGEGITIDENGYDLKFIPFNRTQPVEIGRVLAFYENIRMLPRFDQRQAPLMEIQMDEHGNFHFLQYLKTGHLMDPAEAFEIPEVPEAIQATEVRGATPPEGVSLRIYISPRKFKEHMKGQAFYLDWMDHGKLAPQIMAQWGQAVINNTYLSLKNNHFDSAPFVRAPVAMSVELKKTPFERLAELASHDYTHNIYVDAHIIANGREGVIISEWTPKFEDIY